jgi:chemotaxis protein MotB
VSGEESKAQELVIIRRRGGGEDGGHHGGVWKIAYADFMTAMMAFFLVMWLINSTDKKTLTQVATYFNPLRLTDKRPTPKGLHEPDGSEGSGAGSTAKTKNKDSVAKGATQRDESELGEVRPRGHEFQHGTEPKEQELRSGRGGEIDQSAPRPVGRAFRDPFDSVPRSEITPSEPSGSRAERPQPPPVVGAADGGVGKRSVERSASQEKEPAKERPREPAKAGVAKEGAAEPVEAAVAKGGAAAPARDVAKAAPAKEGAAAAVVADAAKDAAGKDASVKDAAAKEEPAKEGAAPIAKEGGDKDAKDAARDMANREDAAQLEAALRKAVAEALPAASPNVEVMEGPEGVLISLTDDQAFGMFAIASAEPRPAMVIVMNKVAQILQARPEPLIVRGHTDRRQYRNTVTYDNWRLSSARAHMAYVLLARGGIDEKRFERIEGYADRNLKIPGDPEAAQNRRIEILLRKSAP